jgi:hypothetical protein
MSRIEVWRGRGEGLEGCGVFLLHDVAWHGMAWYIVYRFTK